MATVALSPAALLHTLDRGQTAWKIEKIRDLGNLTRVVLLLQDPEIKPPLERRVVGYCLRWDHISRANLPAGMVVQYWRQQFSKAVSLISGNFSGIVEPIDIFELEATHPWVPASLRRGEPLAVFDYNPGDKPVYSLSDHHPSVPKLSREQKLKRIGGFFFDLSLTCEDLARQGVALSHMNIPGICFNKSTSGYVIRDFSAAIPFGPLDIDPALPHPFAAPHLTAPECRRPGVVIGESTSIFSLARALLEYAGGIPDTRVPFPEDISGLLEKTEIELAGPIPPHWVRFLRMALQREPGARFQTIVDARAVFSDREAEYQKVKQSRAQRKPHA